DARLEPDRPRGVVGHAYAYLTSSSGIVGTPAARSASSSAASSSTDTGRLVVDRRLVEEAQEGVVAQGLDAPEHRLRLLLLGRLLDDPVQPLLTVTRSADSGGQNWPATAKLTRELAHGSAHQGPIRRISLPRCPQRTCQDRVAGLDER